MQYGLIGRKLTHSYSKIIHELIGKYDYDLFPLETDKLEKLLKSRNIKGLNVTIPYKKTVMLFCDRLTALAIKIGAVNTLFVNSKNELCGGNTDYTGFLAASAAAGISYRNRKVLIMGTGATSQTVFHAVNDSHASEIIFACRRTSDEICSMQNRFFCDPDADSEKNDPDNVRFVNYDDLSQHDDIEVIINTTPVGMYPDNGASLIDLKNFPKCTGVFDVVYNPFKTDLLLQAADLGILHANGLEMLVGQAIASSRMFTGETDIEPEPENLFDDDSKKILTELKKRLENLVLIGMPGCGKSTLGRLLAEATGKTFIDTDVSIESSEGKSIPDIFAENGEGFFRNAEAKIVAETGKENSLVIATGGGTVLKKENMDALRQNGKIIWLRRPIEKLATSGRPLSKDFASLQEIYRLRAPIYERYADICIEVEDDPQKTLDKFLFYDSPWKMPDTLLEKDNAWKQ